MLKKIYNEAKVSFEFSPDLPILIKSGHEEITGPDMVFVKTMRNSRAEPFVPGSSIKGLLRSYTEKIARTLNEEAACMPYMTIKDAKSDESLLKYVSCGELFKEKYGKQDAPTSIAYKDSCPICKLFGSTYFVGRLETSDAYIKKDSEYALEERDGVGIDRFTGGAAKRAKFSLQVLSQGTFSSSLRIRNFELWQLSLALIALKDFLNGFVRIGYGKSRGLGKVKGTINKVSLHYFGNNLPEDGKIKGIGAFLKKEEGSSYGYNENDLIDAALSKYEVVGLRSTYLMSDIDDFIKKSIQGLDGYLKEWKRPQWMKDIMKDIIRRAR